MDRLAQISRSVNALSPVSAAELEAFVAAGRPRALAPLEAFCATGTREHEVAFIHRGLVRYHVVTDDGDDVTKDFGLSGGFTVSFGSALVGEPARVAITAVEACELTVWPWGSMRERFDDSIAWQRFGRRVAELLYVRKERRELSFLLRSATERYADAAAMFGASLVRIPQYQLASYLGIAPESLSRLRGRQKK